MPPYHMAQNLSQRAGPSCRRRVLPTMHRVHRIWRDPPAGHAADLNAEYHRRAPLLRADWDRGRHPPPGMPLKKRLGYVSRILMLGRVWELLILPEDDDARPERVSDELVDLQAHQRILSHPLDFLTECCVTVEKFAVQVDTNGNDIW